jgi:serine phosphatase RsbU (regulator of sigma subunit)
MEAGGQLQHDSVSLETIRSVVVIEDDAADALLVTEMLADVAPDVTLTRFTTLQAAVARWPEDTDCVLLDLGLPDVFGLAALDSLRAHIADTPIVVLTGRIDDGIGPKAVAAGAQDFLVKGQVDAATLERSLRYAVERRRAAAYERDLIAADLRSQENTRLQRGLLPSPLMDTDELGLALFYRPGSERALLGGDFYDVVQTPSHVHVLIGDVSGHGPDEAALGVALRIAWRALVLAGLSTSDVLRGVEQVLLAERNDEERFATVAMVSLDASLTRGEVVLCGHPRPLIIRGDDVRELDLDTHPMLSALEDQPLQPVAVELDGDWGVLLFTDGLVEGRRAPGARERLGVDELVAHVRDLVAQDIPRAEIAPLLLARAEHCHGGPLTDDVAVLLIGSRRWWR